MMAIAITKLNQFTQKIAEAIELNDWEGLSVILIERQAYFEQMLNSTSDYQEKIKLESIVQSIQAMDKLFVDAVQLKKTELLKQFNTLSQARKVIRAYEHQMTF